MAERRIKLCIVSPYQSGGGSEYQIACLLDQLIPSGRWDIHFLTHNPEPAAAREGVRVVKIGKGTGTPRFGYTTDALPLYRELHAIGPDVIYQRVACGYTGICALFGALHDVPVVWHVASDTDVAPEPDIHGRNPVRRWLEKRSVEYGLRHAQYVVTQTRYQASQMLINYGRSATAVIANFHPAPVETIDKSGTVTVTWVGNLKPWKRPEMFVRLAESLRDLSGVRFIMAGAPASGSGDVEWADALMQSISRTPNLQYIGQQTQQQVNELLARSHLLVSTSVGEGFPNTFIQAWMREVPVVSLDVDPDETLSKESIGICAGSEASLVAAVRQLATDAAMRAAYGTRARSYAIARHSMQNAAQLAEIVAVGK